MWTVDYNNGVCVAEQGIRPLAPRKRDNAFTRLSVSSFRGVAFREKDEFVVRRTEGSNPACSTRESGRTLALYDAFVRGRRLSALRVRILRAPSRRNEPGLWLPLVFSVRLPRLPAAGLTVVWKRGLILIYRT